MLPCPQVDWTGSAVGNSRLAHSSMPYKSQYRKSAQIRMGNLPSGYSPPSIRTRLHRFFDGKNKVFQRSRWPLPEICVATVGRIQTAPSTWVVVTEALLPLKEEPFVFCGVTLSELCDWEEDFCMVRLANAPPVFDQWWLWATVYETDLPTILGLGLFTGCRMLRPCHRHFRSESHFFVTKRL
jgi:hypothetical protein